MSDSEKSVPESSLKKKPGRGWWRRVGWKVALAVLILVIGFYIEEGIRGRRALERAVAEYEAAGESLRVEDFLTKAPPAEENFGATTLLDGMMTGKEGDDPQEAVTNEALKRFCKLAPWPYADSLLDPRALADLQREKARELRGEMSGRKKRKKEAVLDWRGVRQNMFHYGSSKPAKEEPSDVQAVDQALERERALFDELVTAARRPYAVFTPAPADRGASPEGGGYFPADLDRLPRVIRLRVLTAITLGRHQEAANLTKVLWKLREARVAEGGLYNLWMAARMGNLWTACAFDIARAPGVDDGILAQLQMQVPPLWSAEQELLQAARGTAAFTHAYWKKLIDAAEYKFTGDLYGAFRDRFFDRTRSVLYSPCGWLNLAAATDLRRQRLYQVNALKPLDFSVLPHVQQAMHDDEPSLLDGGPWYQWGLDNTNLQYSVTPLIRLRLTLLVLGMERYRRQHGRYPAKAAALMPDFLRAVPKDIDGFPLRAATFEDGARAVVYSIGWNMVDDWHGVVPEKFGGGVERDADLTLSLPFPVLPSP